MDMQSFLNLAGGAAMALLGWLGKTLHSMVRDLERDFGRHKEEVAKTYATNADLERINTKLDRILERLETKVDR